MKCIVCKEKMAEGASFCPKCSHYQNNWLNVLRFCGAVAGIITLLVSALFFIFGKAPQIREQFFPKKSFEVLHFVSSNTRGGTSIFNSSDSDIWVRDVEIDTPLFSDVQGIDLFVSSGKVATRKKFDLPPGEEIAIGYFVENVPAKDWKKFNPSPDSCYGIIYLTEIDSQLPQIIKVHGPKLKNISGTATFNYYFSQTQEWLTKEVSIVAFLEEYPAFCSN